MPLTDVAIRKASPAEKPYKLADGEGLYLLVSATGKYWRLGYDTRAGSHRPRLPRQRPNPAA